MAKHLLTSRQHGIYIAILVLLGAAFCANAQETPEGLTTFLKNRIGLSTKDLAEVRRGEVIAKILRSEPQKVAIFGVVRVNASEDFFLERFRDIESYKKCTSVPQVKKFSTPPRIEDIQQLTVDREDFVGLKNCKVGSCDVKLPAHAIAQLQTETDGNAADASEQVNELARASLLEYANRYLEGGNKALTEYSDKKTPLRLADEFEAILKASPYLYDYEPELSAYLRDYAAKRMDGSEDFIFWSKEKFGLKPVISLTHVSIYRKPESGRTLIASIQI
jgi:hypothetical protein